MFVHHCLWRYVEGHKKGWEDEEEDVSSYWTEDAGTWKEEALGPTLLTTHFRTG
jgi:hypothetical protein